jgi:recombination protein RecT
MSDNKQIVLRDALAGAKSRVSGMLPTNIPEQLRERVAEKMLRVAMLAATKQPKLYDCTPVSVVNAVVAAASLGLELGGVLGEAYLVPFGNACTLVPGYRGLVKLATQGGQVLSVEARLVYKDDTFHCMYGTDPKIIHEPKLSGSHRTDADIVATYMVAHLASGQTVFEVMTRDEVEKVRQVSRGKDSGPWRDWYPEQVKKTVVKRGVKLLPLSPEAALAVELDNRFEVGDTGNSSDILDGLSTEQATKARAEGIKAKLSKVGQAIEVEGEYEVEVTEAK